MALKYFLQTEPLAQHAVKLKKPAYNPFRDFQNLEAASLKLYKLDSFPDYAEDDEAE